MTHTRYDTAEVAEFCREAHADGQSVTAALTVRYGIPTNKASALLKLVRSHGHPLPHFKRGPDATGRRRLDEVAQVALDAHRAGGSMSVALCKHFNTTPDSARSLMSRARKAGHLIPYAPSAPTGHVKPAGDREPSMALSCVCGECFPLDVSQLARHTVQAHRRGPTVAERTPRKVAA